MSKNNPARNDPREAGFRPRVEERAYTLADLASQTNLLPLILRFKARSQLAPILFISRIDPRLGSHTGVSSIDKVHGWAEKLPLTARWGQGMY